MRDFNFAIKNIKVILEAMQTDEFIERGSEYRRAKSKELQEVSKGEEKGKEQLTVGKHYLYHPSHLRCLNVDFMTVTVSPARYTLSSIYKEAPQI